jgi:hypothetical protein
MEYFYYDGLRETYSQICKAERKKPKLRLNEYAGYRRTATGLRVARDQPSPDLEMKQSDAIQATALARTKRLAKEKLKAKGAVPTRGGEPLKTFEEFQLDAGRGLKEELTKKQKENLEQVYLSARALDFDKWVLFTTEML